MALPKVVIVGRPNVGKSSVFNWLVGRRVAIVDPTSGVTRDRLAFLMESRGRYFELVDTGGMGHKDVDGLTDDVERQIAVALDEASLILFTVDAHDGITAMDEVISKKLRYVNKPVICVANKCDTDKLTSQAASEFYRFGRKVVYVSAVNNRNREELLSELLERLPPDDEPFDPNVQMKLAVVGKRNAGKSTFINCLAKSERMIVSEIPGTTRDSVDVRFERNGKAFIAIDTAGVKRKSSLADSLEFYSYARAQRTIRRADIVLLFIDPTTRISKVDKQLSQYILEHHKPCILVVNKWDLAKSIPTAKFNYYLDESFPSFPFAPRAFITAKTGKNVQALIDLGQSLFKQANTRVTTSELNRVINAAVERNLPPIRQNRRPKIYYSAQVATAPPTIVVFCNSPKLFSAPYQRYLLGVCREELPFGEVPIKLYLRKSESQSSLRDSDSSGEIVTDDRVDADQKASDPWLQVPSDASVPPLEKGKRTAAAQHDPRAELDLPGIDINVDDIPDLLDLD